MKARAAVRAVAGRHCTVLADLRSEAPLGLFLGRSETPAWTQVWMVGSAGGPLGGDDVELRIDVGPGAALAVGSVAASVALAGSAPSATKIRVIVEPGGRLVWTPEPLIVTGRANHRVEVVIDAAADAHVWWRDELVLGRSGERPGRCTVALATELGGVPWLRHELAVGAPGWDGAAVVGAYRIVGSVLTTDDTVDAPADLPAGEAAKLQLEAGGSLTLAMAPDRRTLDRLLPTGPAPDPRRSHAPLAHR
jgi:urease accessory protein